MSVDREMTSDAPGTPGTDEVDAVAVRAWPAETTAQIGSWTARATGGYTDRANSVAVAANVGDGVRSGDDVGPAIDAAERFYASRSLTPKFQVSDVGSTLALRAVLEDRGYSAAKPTWVRVGHLSAIDRTEAAGEVVLRDRPTESWFDLWWSIDGRGDEHRGRARALLGRMPPTTSFASISIDGQVHSVALGVADGRWLGLFCAATSPVARGQRLAASITSALARWGGSLGADQAYCQVAADNVASLRLTDRSGFTNSHQYRYFTRPAPPSGRRPID